MTLRTFIAVLIPPPPRLANVRRSLTEMNKPVAVVGLEKLHITLKFLGDTPADQLDTIRNAIATAIVGQSPFTIELRSLGAFPRPDRPSVVWVGLQSAEPLISLARRLESLLEPLSFAPETRPFSPHLTLARIKGRPPQSLFDLLRRHAATSFGTIDVRQIEFIHSQLHPDGSRYSTLSSHTLSALR